MPTTITKRRSQQEHVLLASPEPTGMHVKLITHFSLKLNKLFFGTLALLNPTVGMWMMYKQTSISHSTPGGSPNFP